MKAWHLLICVIGLGLQNLTAQTCCSGGVPVSANLGLPTGEKNQFQLSLSADFNRLQTLKSGQERIDDQSRQRSTNALLIEFGYAFTKRFSLDVFGSYVQQRRLINNIIGSDLEVTNGVGDWVTLAKYKLMAKAERNLTIGAGIKWPIGSSDLRSKRDLPLNADLQPGSGAMDFIGWLAHSQQFERRPSLSWVNNAVYSFKGKNNNYLASSIYQFGNELQLSTGLADQFLIGKIILDAALIIRYRKAQQDEFDLDVLPSTGGDFIFINPGLTYWWAKNSNIFVNINLPLFSKVDGTQLAPTYQLNIGIYGRGFLSKELAGNAN